MPRLFLAVVCFLTLVGSSFAQAPKPAPAPGPARLFPLPIPLPFTPKPKANILDPIVSFIQSDLSAALKQANAMNDGNLAVCITKLQPLAAQLPGNVPVSFNLATDVATWRTLLIIAHEFCEVPQCTQVMQEAQNQIAALGAGVALPSVSGLCAKVPPINLTPVPSADAKSR